MFDIYTDSVANFLQNMFNQYELNISHTNYYYRINGFDYERWQNDIQSKRIEKPTFAIALDYSYISDYKVTNYYSQSEDKKYLFWEYDYKFWFPVNCRPNILIHLPENYANYLNEIMKSFFSNAVVLQIAHPILPKNTIPMKLSIKNITSNIIKNCGGYFSITLDSIIIPWYIYDLSSESTPETVITNKNIQEYILEQVSALYSIYENCKKQFLNNAYQNTNVDNNHIKERLMSIDSNKIILLELLKVQKQYWTEKRINKILYYIKNTKTDLNQAINLIDKESADQAAITDRFIERYRGSGSQSLDSGYDDSPSYVVHDDGSSIGQDLFTGIVSSYIANRGIKKAINKQTELLKEQERERQKEIDCQMRDERHRRSVQQQRERDKVIKINQERLQKGLQPLPLPDVDWY